MPFSFNGEVDAKDSAQETKAELTSRINSTWEDSELPPIFIPETADDVMGIDSAGKDCCAFLQGALSRLSRSCRAARSIKDNSCLKATVNSSLLCSIYWNSEDAPSIRLKY